MGDKYRDFARPVVDCPSYLECGQHQPSRCVQDQIDRDLWVGQLDGTDDFLGVIDIDIAKDRKPQKAHRFLTMDEHDHPGLAFPLDASDHPLPGRLDHFLAEHRLKSRKHEKNPEDVHHVHRWQSP